MKKIFLLALLICFALSGTTNAARDLQSVGVVIVGGVEFKTDDFYKIVRDELKTKSGAKISAGNDLQTLYKKFWLRRGFIGEQPPTKNDLIDFTRTSGYQKVVFVIISDVTLDTHNNAKSREKDRVSIQVDAYLCTPLNVADVFAAGDEELSKTSNLRARRGAFRKCLKEINKELSRHL